MSDVAAFNLQIKDRSEINKELEEFLAKGGKIHSLDYGESTATNSGFNNSSYGDKDKKKPIKSEQAESKKSAKTEIKKTPKIYTPTISIAEEIRNEQQSKVKINTQPSATNPVNNPDIKKQAEIIAKMRTTKKEENNTPIPSPPIKKVVQKTTTTPNVKKPTPNKHSVAEKPQPRLKTKEERLEIIKETTRISKVREARREAESKGLNEFTAPCRIHGSSKYVIVSGTSRCTECQNDSKLKRSKAYNENNVNPDIVSPELSAERIRIRTIKAARILAIQENRNTFTAPCSRHGNTEYKIVHGISRCVACRREQAINYHHKQNQLDSENLDGLGKDLARKLKVRLERNKAIAEGKTEFMAECSKHGLTTYFLKNNNQSRCLACYKQYSKSRTSRLKEERQIAKELEKKQTPLKQTNCQEIKPPKELNRLQKMRVARNEALSLGKTSFIAECEHHGKTNYVIKNGISRCILCLEVQSEKRKISKRVSEPAELERKNINKAQLDIAVSEGKRMFIGQCKVHGIAPHSIDPRIKNGVVVWYECRCTECKNFSKFKTETVRQAKSKAAK